MVNPLLGAGVGVALGGAMILSNPQAQDALASVLEALVGGLQRLFSDGGAELAPSGGARAWNDPGSLEGATPEEVAEVVPEGWVASPTRTGSGVRYANPEARGQQVRVMPGDSRAPSLIKQGPYAIVSPGTGSPVRVPLAGNPVLRR